MRALNSEEQDQRKRKVLQFVIHEYVRTGKPVGSNVIASLGRMGLSPASIRNILHELESEDMIVQPHTSAGRTPTDKGYRVYVDSLIELQRLAAQEQMRIQREYEQRSREIEELMSQTSRMLSSISHYTGFVMAPKLERNVLSHLELIPISDQRILVAMITQSGLAKHFVIKTSLEIPMERLHKISRIINQSFQGCTLQEVQQGIMDKLERVQAEYREIMDLAKEIGQEIRKFSSGSEIYLEGATNILAMPEFSRTDELQNLFKIVEDKQILTNLLEHELSLDHGTQRPAVKETGGRKKRKSQLSKEEQSQSERVHVSIGSENPVKAMQNLSVVSSTYQLADRTVGVLGILGPKRMEYPKMIALVDYVSQMVNRFLKEFER